MSAAVLEIQKLVRNLAKSVLRGEAARAPVIFRDDLPVLIEAEKAGLAFDSNPAFSFNDAFVLRVLRAKRFEQGRYSAFDMFHRVTISATNAGIWDVSGVAFLVR